MMCENSKSHILLKGNIAPSGVLLSACGLPEGMLCLRGLLCRFGNYAEAADALRAGSLIKGSVVLAERQEGVEEYARVLAQYPIREGIVTLCSEAAAGAIGCGAVICWPGEAPADHIMCLRDGDILCYDTVQGAIWLDVAEEGFENRICGSEQPVVVTPLGQGMYSLLMRYSRAFLIVGEDRALLVDAGFRICEFMEVVRGITRLPVELVLTHGHADHIGNVCCFDELWLHPKDLELFRSLAEYKGSIRSLRDGQAFELGGRSVSVLEVPGHTPGSAAFYDSKSRSLFSGDTVATGPVYMFLKGCCLEDLHASLARLDRELSDIADIYPSHGKLRLGRESLLELAACSAEILQGCAEGSPSCVSRVPGTCCTYRHGSCAIFY